MLLKTEIIANISFLISKLITIKTFFFYVFIKGNIMATSQTLAHVFLISTGLRCLQCYLFSEQGNVWHVSFKDLSWGEQAKCLSEPTVKKGIDNRVECWINKTYPYKCFKQRSWRRVVDKGIHDVTNKKGSPAWKKGSHDDSKGFSCFWLFFIRNLCWGHAARILNAEKLFLCYQKYLHVNTDHYYSWNIKGQDWRECTWQATLKQNTSSFTCNKVVVEILNSQNIQLEKNHPKPYNTWNTPAGKNHEQDNTNSHFSSVQERMDHRIVPVNWYERQVKYGCCAQHDITTHVHFTQDVPKIPASLYYLNHTRQHDHQPQEKVRHSKRDY